MTINGNIDGKSKTMGRGDNSVDWTFFFVVRCSLSEVPFAICVLKEYKIMGVILSSEYTLTMMPLK